MKICGITRIEDALLAVELGADLIGLNFYPLSPRCLGVREAQRIAAAVAGRASMVGVFVNTPRPELEQVERRVPLDLLQFHGDERPEDLEPFAGRAIKVFRVRERFAPSELEAYPGVAGFLFDGAHPGLYGGAGAGWPYEWVGGLATSKTCYVAGGIRPATVSLALERSGAAGVDVCSGVEAAPGLKDPELMRELFREVHDVWNRS